MMFTANWSYPTAVRFCAGRISELDDACASAGIKKPLLVTDKGLVNLPFVQKITADLEANGLAAVVFADVDPNPTGENLDAGLEAFRDGGHDGVVCVGGGSALDLGKVIAFMAGQTRPVWDFEDIGDWWTRADADAIAPNIAVPTTSGTGSELGRASVLTRTDTKEKKIIFHPKILPSVVIADPELAMTMPAWITAGTGMDAFAHCLEALSSPHFHPMSHGIALEGLRLVNENLETAFSDPTNLEARANMMAAAMMGAVAFQKGLGAVHALSHPIGAIYGTHHGTTNAVLIPAVLDLNRQAIESTIERVCAYLGIQGGFDGFRARVTALNQTLNIPASLTDLGLEQPDMDLIIKGALIDPSCGGNPVPLNAENLGDVLQKSL
ncbi:MAG: iron-containing alcohol dehydrogenase [Alphaproteobacteria bacterium]